MKYVIISGASGHIGKELSKIYIRNGYNVIGLDKVDTTYDSKKFTFQKIDLATFCYDQAYREAKIKEIKKDIFNNKIEELIIINNAAVQILSEFNEITYQDWHKTLNVNLVAPSLIVQEFFHELKKSNSHVINISSIHAKLTKKFFTCYAASKSALESLTRSMSIELAPYKINVNCIAPAAIETEMLIDGFKDNKDKLEILKKYHPTNSIGQPSDLALFIKNITDNKSDFFTGAIIEFDGGISSKLHDPE